MVKYEHEVIFPNMGVSEMSHKITQQRRLSFAIIKKMTIDYSLMTQPAPVIHEFTETSVRIYLLSEYPLHTLRSIQTQSRPFIVSTFFRGFSAITHSTTSASFRFWCKTMPSSDFINSR